MVSKLVKYQQNVFLVIYEVALAAFEGILESEGKYLAHFFSHWPFFPGLSTKHSVLKWLLLKSYSLGFLSFLDTSFVDNACHFIFLEKWWNDMLDNFFSLLVQSTATENMTIMTDTTCKVCIDIRSTTE